MAYRSALILTLVLASSSAFAGWTVSTFSAPNSDFTYILCNSEGKQAGGAIIGGQEHAGVWSGSSASWVDLNPTGSTYSTAMDISGNQEVGYAMFANHTFHAGFWTGSAESWVDLNPAGFTSSFGYGAWNGQQVGYAHDGYNCFASMWSGTADSWVNLNPPGYYSSSASGISDGQIVGKASRSYDEAGHAGYWTGTAESWVDIHPDGYADSEAYDASDGWQVGQATAIGDHWHAGMWHGTAESWVDLNPEGSIRSEAYGILAGKQLGFVYGPVTGNQYHAAMWSGTAESWFDLHSLLSPDYDSSDCRQLEIVGDDMWIGGAAINTAGRDVAILWHYTPDAVPEPSSLVVLGTGLLALPFLRRKS